MALNEKQLKRLDKLDFAKGGGFSDFITNRQKMAPSSSKFLFIGLGGKGSETVASIKTEVYKKIKCNDAKKRPNNFEYLIIDTDTDTIDHLVVGGFGEVGLSANPADSEACQLYDAKAAGLLKPGKRDLIPNYINEWLNPTMNQTLQGKGAGGIRQAGRYLLFGPQAFKTVQNALTQKLGNLHGQIIDSAKEDLIVYIFAGVSGGTGSGTVIDIPYIIRKICGDKGWKVKLYGYIFLPDTYNEKITGNHLKYNAYAALKEIDTLMNIDAMGGSARFKATYTPGFTVDSVERIFDSCVLVSGKKENGGLVKNPEKFSKHVVVDNIVNLVTDNQTDDGFLANSFLDNSPTEIQNAVNTLSEKSPRNAYYQYTVIGTGAMTMPLEQILAYIAHGTMDMLVKAWDRHAEQKHVEGLLGKVHMQPQEQANEIISKSSVPLMQYTKGIGGPAKKQQVLDDSLYNTIKQYWMAQNAPLYDAWDVAKNHCLERVIGQLTDEYYSIFKDPDRGIYFLKELLSFRVIDGNSINGVLFRLENEYKASIQGFASGQEQLQLQMEARMREIKGELDAPFCFRTGSLIEEYRELCVARLVSENMVSLYTDLVRDNMNQIIAFVDGKIEELQKYIDVFTYMKDIVDNNYQIVMKGDMPQAEYAGSLIDFSDKTDEATMHVIRYLDDMLGQKKPEGLVSALEGRIIGTENSWVHSEDDFNPMSVFVKFLESQFAEIPNLSIEKFLEIKHGVGGVETGMQSVCQELKNKAEVIFPASVYLPLNSLASHHYVVIPAGALEVTSAMESFAKLNGATVAKSADMNSMYWYNLIIGVPLYALVGIEDYERLYESNQVSGMHIRETAEDNWKDLPALTNQDMWQTVNFNMREKNYIEEVKKNLKKFLDCGILVYDPSEELYYAYCPADGDDSVKEEEILKWCEEVYLKDPEVDENGLKKAGVSFFERLRTEKNFTRYLLNLTSVYMKFTDANLYKLVRMQIFLYRKMLVTYQIYEKCEAKIISGNDSDIKAIRKKRNMRRLYDYVRCGVILLDANAVILEREDGEQEEIMYFDDHTQIENQFFVYYAFDNFTKKYSEEELEELDEHLGGLMEDKSSETREERRELANKLMEECGKARESLKKLATKRELAENGMTGLTDDLVDFYEGMLRFKTGR